MLVTGGRLMDTHASLIRTAATIIAFGLLSVGATQAATLYKWTDEEGNVHYSQTRPEETKADRMQIKDSKKPQQKQEEESVEPPENAGQDPRKLEARKRNCDIARANMEVYKNSERIKKPDGTVVTLSDEMRQSKIKEAQAMIDENCQ